MKFVIVLFAAVCAANASTSKWVDFRVKYSGNPADAGTNAFWQVQKTLSAALSAGWVKVTTTNALGATAVCYSQTDVRVCPLYDAKGFIAGMQLAIPPSNVEGQGIPYDFNRHPVFEKKAINGVTYWTSTYYIVDPKVIQSGGRPSADLIGTGLWLKSGNSYTQVPTDLASIQSKTVYTWQNCIPNMGIHYYHNMKPTMKCEDAEPYFLLIKDGNIVGLGWQFNGKTNVVGRNWYDAINGQAVRMTVPNGPTCLADGADKYGVISIHMYFVDKPWTIPCKQSTDSVSPIPGLP